MMAPVSDTTAHDRWEKEAAAAPRREQPPTTVSDVRDELEFVMEKVWYEGSITT